MRKMKKNNGYLVVKFNDRELREWEGTALGNYGVIDAELYTGTLEADQGVMEYDDAETLEEAIEKIRGLESECDVEEPESKRTAIKEPEDSFKARPNTPTRERFEHLQNEITQNPKLYALGFALAEDCPDNDCHIYLNIFNMARELDAALNDTRGYAALTLQRELLKLYRKLQEMYLTNYAVEKYRAKMKEEPPAEQTAPGGAWELETVSAPFVRHSHKINVIHPQVIGEFEVSKVVSATNAEGFIHTTIYF